MNTCPNCDPPVDAVTVMLALPLCPSLVAVIVAEPATFPVTSPLGLTVATAVLLLDHAIVRPDSGFPFASFGVAVSCTVLPSFTLAGDGLTVTEATGTGVTVIADVPPLPSDVAVIVAEPATTPLTSPLPFTVATEVLLLDQVTTRPVSGLPLASFGVAVSCRVCPTARLAGDGLTVTVATGTVVTVIPALPLCPSLVAVIIAEPATFAVTRPLVLTVATVVLSLNQVIVRPGALLGPERKAGADSGFRAPGRRHVGRIRVSGNVHHEPEPVARAGGVPNGARGGVRRAVPGIDLAGHVEAHADGEVRVPGGRARR